MPLAASRNMIVIAAVGLGLFLAGCGSGSPEPKPKPPDAFYGVNPGNPPDAEDFQEMADAGVETVRINLGWAGVQPEFGAYNWTSTDQTIGGLAAQGLEPLPVLQTTPAWVADQATTPPLSTPRARRAWTSFLKAAVDRYGPDGSFWQPGSDGSTSPYHALCECDAKALPITSWQVWNEPSLVHYYTPTPSVAGYAELLRISHDAITGQDPHAEIVLAGLPGFASKGGLDAWKYLAKLFRRPGVNDAFDVVALHPYARKVGQLQSEIQKVRTVMSESGNAAKPLWITELGWGSAPPDRFGLNKGVQGQKHLLTGAYRVLLRSQAEWNLERVYWFEWRDPPPTLPHACSFCGSAGLLRNDHQPKPAYRAFTDFTGRHTGDG
jgi:hypothetical protein